VRTQVAQRGLGVDQARSVPQGSVDILNHWQASLDHGAKDCGQMEFVLKCTEEWDNSKLREDYYAKVNKLKLSLSKNEGV